VDGQACSVVQLTPRPEAASMIKLPPGQCRLWIRDRDSLPVRIAVTRLATGDGGGTLGPAVRFTVQVGSFSSQENARALERSLADGFPGVQVVRRAVGADTYYRVWVGDFSLRVDAEAMAEKLASRGLSVLILERDR